ncbi:uncharacterized protein STEHIDRAFT_66136, partial [Stereum hirsutum FP-91666 SS1]|uniref:uncharacterized protein n=1 Tax=Stereum hirsutum (strain FP-91666) TaxID=721885 RepID=UPI000444A88C
WKGTLDTMLVFIALFSAIIATFFVESLAGLAQDPASETNDLLRNLTELLIVISGTDTAHLDIAPPTPFQPDGSAVRLNLYWSISLILSVSLDAKLLCIRALLI